MKTINLRILVQDDDVDAEDIATKLTIYMMAVPILGAVELVNNGFGHLVPSPQVRTRPNIHWNGEKL